MNSIYTTLVTTTDLGYGDDVPTTTKGMLSAIGLIIGGLLMYSYLLLGMK